MEQEQQAYVVSGLDAVNLKLVYSADDLNGEAVSFRPDMCHQIFSETENIFGYTNLSIDINYAASSMNCYVDVRYDEAATTTKEYANVKADDIMELLDPWLPDNFTVVKDEFVRTLANDDPKRMYGRTLSTKTLNVDGRRRTFLVSHCGVDETGFKEFHSRFETFIVWFIDAANLIDINDPRWEFYMLYERLNVDDDADDAVADRCLYYPIGYCTVYKYYAYPEHVRPRISQFLVLPPFQKMGLGTYMLNTVYQFIWDMPKVKDITVEDPSEEFQKLRDYLDAKNLNELAQFSSPVLQTGFNSVMFAEANKKFKINDRQCRRVYEILKYLRVKRTGKGLKEYKSEMQHRLYAPFRKQDAKNKRIPAGKVQFDKTVVEQRQNHVKKEMSRLLAEYDPVVDRLITETATTS